MRYLIVEFICLAFIHDDGENQRHAITKKTNPLISKEIDHWNAELDDLKRYIKNQN